MARAIDQRFIPQFRFHVSRHGMDGGIGFSRVESLPDKRILLERLHTADELGLLAKAFGDGGVCHIYMIEESRARVIEFTVQYTDVGWLPFKLDAKSSDMAMDRIHLIGAHISQTSVATFEEFKEIIDGS